jgi:hypothetical protein
MLSWRPVTLAERSNSQAGQISGLRFSSKQKLLVPKKELLGFAGGLPPLTPCIVASKLESEVSVS